jgi:hypothetical protein
MDMKSIVATIILLGSALVSDGQEPAAESTTPPIMEAFRLANAGREASKDEIETDRDSFTPAVTTTGKGRFIFESAWSFIDNRGRKETHSFPEFLLRSGVTDRLELRLGWNYEVAGAPSEIAGGEIGEELPFERKSKLERESTLSYGLKYRISEQDGWKPASSAIVQGFTPTSGNATESQIVATYVFGWELPNQMKLDAAIRYGTGSEAEDHFNEWAPSVVLKAPLSERINVHAEYFAIFSSGKEEKINNQYFSPGIHFLLTEDLEVGFRLGWGLNDQTAKFFSNVGVGVRY